MKYRFLQNLMNCTCKIDFFIVWLGNVISVRPRGCILFNKLNAAEIFTKESWESRDLRLVCRS